MKKAFYMMAAAAIALSSCSSEETTDVAKSSNITFRSAVGFNTRGVEMTNADGYKMTKMTVSAFDESGAEFFKNYVFKEKNGEFTSSERPSWPNHGSLNFVAYSHSGGDWTGAAPVLKKDGATIAAFSPKSAIGEQLDVVFAQGKGDKASHEANGLLLNFDHILSQIKIKAKHSSDTYTYQVKGIRIAYVGGSADYTFNPAKTDATKHTWTAPAAKNVVYEKVFDQAVSLTKDATVDLTDKCNADGKVGGAMLIPQTLTVWNGTDVATNKTDDFSGKAYISLLINVKRGATSIYPSGDTDGTKFGWAAVAIPADADQTTASWVAGNKYIYTLNLTNGCGQVDPVDPGTDVNPGGADPAKPKDPNKGDKIFGKEIKFTVNVVDWKPTPDENGTNIPM
mgnify:FL=1